MNLQKQIQFFLLIYLLTIFVGCNRAPQADQKAEIDTLRKQVEQLQKELKATPTPTPQEVNKPALEGSVFYRKGSGDSVILRSLPIYLFTPEKAGAKYDPSSTRSITDTLDHVAGLEPISLNLTWKLRQGMDEDGGRTALRSASDILSKMEKYLTGAEYRATTNVDGKYKFEGVPAGKYQVVALLDTSTAKGFWYFAVSISNDKTITLDLNNSNITQVWDFEAEK